MPQDHSLPAVIPSNGVDTYRMSTDAAAICGAIVKATAQTIQGKKYVKVEGWQAIAIAHGCVASSRDVEVVEGGIRAIGEVRRMSDGFVIATAEGFVGDDEKTWASRPMFARRAMTQTRAISRACRSAFAHVVVMIDKSLMTTPAEEMQGVHDVEVGNPRDYVDEAVRDGLVTNGDTRSMHEQTYIPAGKKPENIERTKQKVDAAVGTFGLSGQSVETLDIYWKANTKDFNWILKHIPAEYERLERAYLDARAGAIARLPNTLQAG